LYVSFCMCLFLFFQMDQWTGLHMASGFVCYLGAFGICDQTQFWHGRYQATLARTNHCACLAAEMSPHLRSKQRAVNLIYCVRICACVCACVRGWT
jgi:hypothetical protein